MVVSKVQQDGYIALATLPSRCVCYLDTSKPLHSLNPSMPPDRVRVRFVDGGRARTKACV
jgi:hypothetical protein